MISLDQVYLLEQKVESAVVKIQQLQAENDALRKRCDELTNALSSKSEQLSSFESDQNQIEDGIKKALDRLDFIENSVLKRDGQAASPSIEAPASPVVPSFDMMESAPEPESNQEENPETEEPEQEVSEEVEEEFQNEEVFSEEEEISIEKSFDAAPEEPETKWNTNIPEQQPVEEEFIPEDNYADDESQDGLGFDIF